MLGFAPISQLPLDTLPANNITGTGGFTESGEALSGAGAVINPILATGGIGRFAQSSEPPKQAEKQTERKQERKVKVIEARTATARFKLSSNRLRGTGFVLNPITGTGRFTEGRIKLRGTGEVLAITERDFEDLELVEELLAL